MRDPIVIVSLARTPIGCLQGTLSTQSASDLGASCIQGTYQRAGLNPENIQEVIMGCVLPAGQGQAPARQASMKAGIPSSIGATTINKMCGSGMKAIMLGHDTIAAGTNQIVIAGGMESMSQSPYLLEKARSGYRMGHGRLIDHMFLDGLEDAYQKGTLMGVFAEKTAAKYQFDRKAQDEFAIASLQKAQNAIKSNAFTNEIITLQIKHNKQIVKMEHDEIPHQATIEKIPTLRSAFKDNGTVTAANASSIADGAASVLLMLESTAKTLDLKPLARIVAHSTFAQEPAWFTTAPVGAISILLKKVGWSVDEVDLFEINEAFAVVTMAAIRDLELDSNKVNVHGGACALGHPIGATGARIICSLINALHRYQKNKGIAALCIGGGEATAIAIERIPS